MNADKIFVFNRRSFLDGLIARLRWGARLSSRSPGKWVFQSHLCDGRAPFLRTIGGFQGDSAFGFQSHLCDGRAPFFLGGRGGVKLVQPGKFQSHLCDGRAPFNFKNYVASFMKDHRFNRTFAMGARHLTDLHQWRQANGDGAFQSHLCDGRAPFRRTDSFCHSERRGYCFNRTFAMGARHLSLESKNNPRRWQVSIAPLRWARAILFLGANWI